MAAVRPSVLTLVSLFLLVTLTDAMRSLDVLPLTRMFPVYLSRDFYGICMSHGDLPRLFFVMLTFSRLCLLLIFGDGDSS